MPYTPPVGSAALEVRKGGVSVGTRAALNVIQGSGTTETVADNSGTGAVDVTFAATAASSLDDIRIAGQGLLSETCDIATIQFGFTTQGQQIYATGIPLRAGQVVSKAMVFVISAASGLTVAYLALYNSSYSRVAVSANSTGSFGTGGAVPSIALSYTVPSDGLYYLAALFDGTTKPDLAVSADTYNTGLNGLDGGARRCWQQTGQTTMPASATAASTIYAIWGAVK